MICLNDLIWILLLLFMKNVNCDDHSLEQTPKELLQVCPESCPYNNQQFNTTETTSDWCLGVNFSEPPIQFKIPKCKNVTVNVDVFNFFDGYKKIILEINGKEMFSDYVISEDSTTVNICYPLSPQLQNCELKLLDRRLYAYNNQSLSLQNCKRLNELIAPADFYELPNSEGILGCIDSLGYKTDLEERRCHYVNLGPTEYELQYDNTTIRMVPSNRLIKQALYTTIENSSNIRMCFPVSTAMTKCGRNYYYPYEYSQKTDYRVHLFRIRQYISLGDYLIDSNEIMRTCKIEEKETPELKFYYYCYIIQFFSAALIILAIFIHLILPSINNHAKPLLCQMISMAIFYIASPYRSLYYPENKIGCYIVFGFCYYSSLTSFFWLNVLSFDMWSIFANLPTSSLQLCANMCDKKPKFLLYCLYAYLIPLLMIIFSIILETNPSMQDTLDIHPDILGNCWFSEPKSLNIFYFGPVLFLLVLNVVFFLMTVYNLRCASKGAKIVNKERNKQLFLVCIKIFVIMGLCWITQLILNLTNVMTMKIIAYTFTSIQGILLFIIYICKPSTYRIIRRKLRGSKSNSSNGHSSGISMETVINDNNTK